MFNPTREQARDFLFEAWRKYRTNEPLSGMETIAVEAIVQHSEYHALLDHRERFLEQYRDRDYPPEFGETNPFLHLNMHIAIREQIAVDQPAGVRASHLALSQKLGSALDAEHEMMDCLGEMIWQAQRAGVAPDAAIYRACLARKIG